MLCALRADWLREREREDRTRLENWLKTFRLVAMSVKNRCYYFEKEKQKNKDRKRKIRGKVFFGTTRTTTTTGYCITIPSYPPTTYIITSQGLSLLLDYYYRQ